MEHGLSRIRLTLAYEGTAYLGWQLQPQGPTIQGELERALAAILQPQDGEPVRVHGSGRTDAGVHAVGQVAHFDAPSPKADLPWQAALNAHLPPDIRVLAAGAAPQGFHARFSARAKTYAYSLWHEPAWVLPQRRNFVWNCGPVDTEAMARAARLFLGEHDFAAFQNTGAEVEGTVRELTDFSLHPGLTENESLWRVTATGFLKQMVRNLMGCLVAVGRGKLEAEAIPELLARGDRTLAPGTAPARGLCLESVKYDPS